MASKGQIEKALEVKVVATGQPLEYNPYQRINRSGAELFRRSAPRIRIQAKVAEPHGRYSYRSSGVEAVEMELYNVDGEIMLKHIYGSKMFFGRHDPTEESNRYGSRGLGRQDENGILHDKAEKTAKDLQKILEDAGYGKVPPAEAVTLREIREDYRQVKSAYSSATSARQTLRERELRHVRPGSATHDLSMAAGLMAEWLRSFDQRIEDLEAALKPEPPVDLDAGGETK